MQQASYLRTLSSSFLILIFFHVTSSDNQPNQYTCTSQKVFYTASVIWGAIGPRRIFSAGAIYDGLQWFWLVGAVAPVFVWLLARRSPRSFWRYIHVPLILGGSGFLPPATTYIYLWVFLPPPAPAPTPKKSDG